MDKTAGARQHPKARRLPKASAGPGLSPGDRQSLRRGAGRSLRLRGPPADHRRHRPRRRRRPRARRHHRHRRGRRQHPARRAHVEREPVAADRRRDGHARHGDERAGAGNGDLPAGRVHPHHDGAGHATSLRNLRAAAGDAPFRGKQGGDLRRRHRQPLFHHRHDGRAARRRDGLRCGPQGDQCGRHLHRRPQARPHRHALRPADPPGGD